NILLDTTQTDNNGFYIFKELLPDDYYIQFILPDGYLFTKKNQGDDREVDSDADELTGKTDIITLMPSTTDLSWDAGLYSSGQEEFDLMLEMTVSNSNPNDEENIFYTLTVTNISPVDAHNVEVTDLLPAGLDYLFTEPANYDTSNSIWSVGDIPSGESEDLNIHVKVNYKDLSLSPPIDLGIASDYNLFVLKDVVQPSSDTEGKVAVGRNASFSNYSIGDKLPPSGGAVDVLIVGRKLTFTSGIVFGGNIVYGEFIDIPQYAVSVVDGTIRQENPVPIDFDQAETELLSVSSQLASREANGTVETQWGGLVLTGTDPMFNVFEMDGELLSNSNNMTITVPSGAVVIVNITGETISWSGGLSVSGTDISNVLYNFNDATDLTISGIDVRGSVLAPKAHVNFIAGVINGQMLCQYFEGRGQMNNIKFRGFIPGNPEITNCADITYSEPTDTNKSNNSACVTIYVNVNPDPNEGTSDEQWEEVSGFELNEMIWSMYQSSNGLLLGTVGGHIYQNTASGWELLNDGMSAGFIWSLFENNGIIYAGTDQGLYKYDGSNWEAMELTGDVRSILILDNTLYAAVWGKGVFYSNNNGQTWTGMNDGLIYYSTQPLAVIDGELFVGTFGQGVLKYDFENSTWTELPIEYKLIWTLTTDAIGNIYAGTSGSGVYTSKDGGSNWTQINTGLPDQYIYLLSTYENEVYAATWFGGIYKLSESDGTMGPWKSIGMRGIQVSSMYVDKSSGTLFAGTSSGVVYKTANTATEVNTEKEIPTEYSLSQNYPNPFNPSTIIKYSIPSLGRQAAVGKGHVLSVQLKVYDILGREVAALVNKQQKPGYYEVNWNASNMPSGIYFYQIRVYSTYSNRQFIKTNKMILMK
ncbi:MAG: choice-of-anchor A family protein, partial [Chlorobi bacterium]|nr:choice-of-anchor A family protein [Chlorobiota bacterium]